MRLAITKLESLGVASPKWPRPLWWTPLPSTRKIIQLCLPGKFETDYSVKAFAHMTMCPVLAPLIGKFLKNHQKLRLFTIWRL